MKGKKQIIHKPSTIDIFSAVSTEKVYSNILLQKKNNKEYSHFLKILLENDFFHKANERTSIKGITEKIGVPVAKATKWIKEIYDDIFLINEEDPELFRNEGILHDLCFSYFDNYCVFSLGLKYSLRKYESLSFEFIKPKMGTFSFWIQDIRHEISNGKHIVSVQLKGGVGNEYQEFITNKALFEGKLNYKDFIENYDYQIEAKLKKFYQY